MTSKECFICYEETDKDDFKVLNPCKHEICGKCMKECMNRRIYTCPMCRSEFNPSEHSSSNEYLQPISVMQMISMLNTSSVSNDQVNSINPILLLPVWREEIRLRFSNERSENLREPWI